MNWQIIVDFFSMGGYAFYVWSSFSFCFLCFIVEPILLGKRHRAIITQLQCDISSPPLIQSSDISHETKT